MSKLTKQEIKEYIQDTADDYGVPHDIATELFAVLGESEMYDGFITMLEDYSAMYSEDC